VEVSTPHASSKGLVRDSIEQRKGNGVQGLRLRGWSRAGEKARRPGRRLNHGARIRSRQRGGGRAQPRLLRESGGWGVGCRASKTLVAVVPIGQSTVGTLRCGARGSLLRTAGGLDALMLFVGGRLEGMMDYMSACRGKLEQCQSVHRNCSCPRVHQEDVRKPTAYR
jgi:hypothetical protein